MFFSLLFVKILETFLNLSEFRDLFALYYFIVCCNYRAMCFIIFVSNSLFIFAIREDFSKLLLIAEFIVKCSFVRSVICKNTGKISKLIIGIS